MAVAIHITYFSLEKEIRIHHFVSDSNYDINDPAGKFSEALEKLKKWQQSNSIQNTLGLDQFNNCYENQKYPGLGSIKKMSIMHHIEMISLFLDGKIK